MYFRASDEARDAIRMSNKHTTTTAAAAAHYPCTTTNTTTFTTNGTSNSTSTSPNNNNGSTTNVTTSATPKGTATTTTTTTEQHIVDTKQDSTTPIPTLRTSVAVFPTEGWQRLLHQFWQADQDFCDARFKVIPSMVSDTAAAIGCCDGDVLS
jgi:hypothetical protein